MPITPAHAAAAWPLKRAFPRLPLAALVIGTLSPDLEYLLRLRPVGKFGHSAEGLVLFCLPLTLLLWWLWRGVIAPSLLPLLPPGPRQAAERPLHDHPPGLLSWAACAALFGALSHVIWDGLTHPDGWAVVLIPWLGRPPTTPASQPPYFYLQYFTSFTAALVVVAWVAQAFLDHPPEARRFAPGQKLRLVRAVVLVLGFSAAVALANASVAPSLIGGLARAAVGAELGLGLGLLLYAGAWHLRQARRSG
jgi:hypothetical protein